uniref:COP1-interacting protein 7 n=1 Tax=Kalanchoe fedtschenkoi TaxID=63787 RepID=A0A7N0RDS8_KALFE
MDPRARIDYALFHLTPTRTRCDLVIFANGQSEKLASGLLQPFLLHLKSAKEQIQKGGYSIALAPPAPAAWFTKATLQRFVRFVSSPEVLERFVTIEKEIEQIEASIRSTELPCEEIDANGKEASADETRKKTASASSEANGEINGAENAAPEEHSKVRLQRVLETRKAVLHKEQAMAYARALVTGFQPGYLDTLVSFADTFGASRLREACCDFIELCKKKNQDRLWMAEVAAMQACHSQLSYSGASGIVLADDDSGVIHQYPVDASAPNQVSDQPEVNGKPQSPSPWANIYPQYFPNYYGQIHPQNMPPPPYQGYPFPGMQAGNPYFPGNVMSDSGRDRKGRSPSGKKGKSSQEKGLELGASEQDVSGGSSSESASEETGKRFTKKKGSRKKSSSKKVVIRNINYISSKKDEAEGSSAEDNSEDGEELFDGDSIKQQIEEAVGSLNRHRRQKKQRERKHANGSTDAADTKGSGGEKMAESWGAFQSILMRDQVANSNAVNPVLVETDRQRVASSDLFVVSREAGGGGDGMRSGNFDGDESFRPRVKSSDGADEMMMLSRGVDGGGTFVRTPQADYASRSSVVRSKTGDWHVVSGSSFADHSSERNLLVGEGEYSSEEKGRNGVVDDSFMVQGHSGQRDSELKTDLSMVLDIAAPHQQNGVGDEPQEKREAAKSFEPDDLYMVLDRSSSADHFVASWTPEMDYGGVAKVGETGQNHPSAEDEPKAKGKGAPKEARSKASGGAIGRSRSEILSRSRKPPPGAKTVVRKSKQELDEERKQRMEELLIQRQKRIAERKANSVASATSNKESAERKRSVNREKPPLPVKSSTQDKKPVLRTSTIARLASARISKPVPETTQPKIASLKAGKDVGHRAKKVAPSKEIKRNAGTVSIGLLASNPDVAEKMGEPERAALDLAEAVLSPVPAGTADSETNGKNADDLGTENSDISAKKDSDVVEITSLPAPAHAAGEAEEAPQEKVISQVEISTESNGNLSSLPADVAAAVEEITSPEKATAPAAFEGKKASDPPALNTKQAKASSVTFAAVTKVSEIHVSTPPSESPDSVHFRKKWDTSDGSTKVARGLKKLLMFGRKSRPISYA